MVPRSVVIVCLTLAGVVISACSPSSKADVDFLASNAHVVVGDVSLVLPFVALRGYVGQKASFTLNKQRERQIRKERLEAFRQAAADSQTAPTIPRLEVAVRTYGWDDFDAGTERICTRLTRQWSKSVCDNPWAALRQALPSDRFDLIDLRTLHDSAKGNVRNCLYASDRNKPVNLQIGEASLLCEAEVYGSGKTRYYTAAVMIDRNLGALWTVWEGGRSEETAKEMAVREGKAISAFVTNGLGSVEDFVALQETVCALRRPNSSDAPSGSDCRQD